MARFAEGSIAGIALQDTNGLPIRVDVLDAEALNGNMSASSVEALDLTVHTQLLSTLAKSGHHFGVKLYQVPISVLDSIVVEMEDAMLASTTFEVTLSDDDGIDTISVAAVVDYQAQGGKAYTRGNFSGVYVRDVTLRFISTGVITEMEGSGAVSIQAASPPADQPPPPEGPSVLLRDVTLGEFQLFGGQLDRETLTIDGGTLE